METVKSKPLIKEKSATLKNIIKYKQLYSLMIPGLILLIIFLYLPMGGIVIAFKDYTYSKGIMGSPWVGLKYFKMVFSDPYFFVTLKNTLIISVYKMVFGFLAPVIFALLLNEVSNKKFKKLVQTTSYLPYFISWVILSNIVISIFSLDGVINTILINCGMEAKSFMTDPTIFRPILVITEIWKGFGWGAIVYLASISGIDPQLYEAATVDGASRFRKVISITIPSIVPTVCIMLILNSSSILNAGFDQIFNLYNANVMDVADIIDTYVYRKGIADMQYSYSTAIGLFKSLVSLVLIVSSNMLVKKLGGGDYALW